MNSGQQPNVTVLIFSKDRPLQLDATLRSFMLHCPDFHLVSVWVIVKASSELFAKGYRSLEKEFAPHANLTLVAENDFRKQVLHLLGSGDYVLWLVDDNIFVRDFDLNSCRQLLDKEPDALGYSLRLGANTTYCYSLNQPQPLPRFDARSDTSASFVWTSASCDFGYPLEVSSSLYRTGDMLRLLEPLDFCDPNSLEAVMAQQGPRFAASFPKMLCADRSLTFCNPINKVQSTESQNRAGAAADLSAAALLHCYLAGKRIDVAAFTGFTPNACHQEVAVHFTEFTEDRGPGPLVSVVIPCYNQAHFLADAVESVVAQSYRNWECIIVNDGSPDNTSEVAQDLIDRFPGLYIRLLEKPNGGLADARNFGIARAGGVYILPLDSDDTLDPEMLDKTVLVLESHPELAIVYTDLVMFGVVQKRPVNGEYDAQTEKYVNLLNYCSLYRREVWVKVGGYNTNMTWGYEDWDFWIGAGELGFVAQRLPEALLNYRVKSQSMFTTALEHDAELKAQIVLNHPRAYSEAERIWARKLLSEPAPAPALPAGTGRRVAVVANFYHDSGGTEALARNIADGLGRMGYHAELVYLTPVPRELLLQLGNVRESDVAHSVEHARHDDLVRTIRELAPDTVLLLTDIFGDTLDYFVGLDFRTNFKKVVYLNINNQAFDYLNGNREVAEQRSTILKRYDSVATMFEESLAVRFFRQFGVPYEIIVIGIPEIRTGAHSFKERHNIPAGSHLLVYPALVAPLKNQVALVEVAGRITADVHIVFLGNPYLPIPEYVNEFQAGIARSANCIHLPGLSREDVAQAMSEASLCLFPSLSEGSPLTLIEAASQGLPWIATPQVVFARGLGGGVISEISQFPAQIDHLLGNPAQLELLGKEGRAHFEREFRIEQTVTAFGKLIDMLHGAPCASTGKAAAERPLKVVHLATTDFGGAGKAAYRLHKGLQASGIDSTMLVVNRINNDPSVRILPSGVACGVIDCPEEYPPNRAYAGRIWEHWTAMVSRYPERAPGMEIFSDDFSEVPLECSREIREADIVNLHWVAGLLNCFNAVRALRGKKIVWTMHDMNPITGGCHYAGECTGYLKNCGNCPMLGSSSDDDISRSMWQFKEYAYGKLDLHPVSPSKWLARVASQSSLLAPFPTRVIPNGFPSAVFTPSPRREEIRNGYGVPKGAKLVLFGAESLLTERKGFVYLLRALKGMGTAGIIFGFFGKIPEEAQLQLNLPLINLGFVKEESALAELYSMADLFVIPSIEDNLPNTVVEAMLCGVPVVGFDIGGIPDMIEHKRTGYLVPPRDVSALVDGINWCLFHPDAAGMGARCREKALASYAAEVQAASYSELYRELLAPRQEGRPAP